MSSLKYLILVKFQATCWERFRERQQDIEIIEYPAVLLNTSTGQIESEFHKFVRPTRVPMLSEFCKNLTGITQSLIDRQETFPTVFREFQNWLDTITAEKRLIFATRMNRSGENVAFCSWSSWDFKEFLSRDCRNHSMALPAPMKVFIDIRSVFRGKYKIQLKFPEAMQHLNVPSLGKDHSGIDDARNLARFAMQLIAKGQPLSKTTDWLL